MAFSFSNGGIFYLVEEYGHEEVVNAECLRGSAVVIFEEEGGEDNDEVLAGGVTEGAPEHLEAAHHDDQGGQAAIHMPPSCTTVQLRD